MVPGRGFEPRFTASKAAVLPLDDPGSGNSHLFRLFFALIGPVASTYILGTYRRSSLYRTKTISK